MPRPPLHPALAHLPRHLRRHLDGCRPWRGVLDGQGYPRQKVRGQSEYAHRLAYERRWGRLEPGERVYRRCGDRTCTNPYHLTVTPPARKERRRPGTAKLTARGVRAIRRAWARPKAERPTQAELAKRYGVSRSCISLIVRRITWADVT